MKMLLGGTAAPASRFPSSVCTNGCEGARVTGKKTWRTSLPGGSSVARSSAGSRILVGGRHDLFHRVAQRPDLGGDELRERPAPRAQYRCAREERLDGHEAERLVPLSRVPQAAGARQQRGLRRTVHLAHVLHGSGEARPPATRYDQAVAALLCRFDRPVIALGAVELPEEQVV